MDLAENRFNSVEDEEDEDDDTYEFSSIQERNKVSKTTRFLVILKNCFFRIFLRNREFEQLPARGFTISPWINCIGALYFLRLGYVLGDNGFVWSIIGLFVIVIIIITMQFCNFMLYHYRPYFEDNNLTLFLILKKTFGIEIATILSIQRFLHHILNCLINLVGMGILFSHFFLTPFFEKIEGNASVKVLSVSITAFIFLVVGVGTSFLIFNIKSIFLVLSHIFTLITCFLCVMFVVSLIFQEGDIDDGFISWIYPSNNFNNLLWRSKEYLLSNEALAVQGNLMAILSPIVMDISFCRTFENIKVDHIRSAISMDVVIFSFTFVCLVLASFTFVRESLLFDCLIFLKICFVPWLVCILLAFSICYSVMSYLQSCADLIESLIHHGEWKYIKKYLGIRKSVLCFLIHIIIFMIYIVIEYFGISLFIVSRYCALVTFVHIVTMHLVMLLMLLIGRLPPKRIHTSSFMKFIFGLIYSVGAVLTMGHMLVLSVQVAGVLVCVQFISFFVIGYYSSPYTGVLTQYILLHQMKKILKMSRFSSRDRLKSLNILHFVPSCKNSYPSIALFTLLNNFEGIYTIANISNPQHYDEGEHLHRIKKEREFWISFLEDLQLRKSNMLLKIEVNHSVRSGIQSICLTNEWKRNIAALGFPTPKKRDLKLSRYGLDVNFASEALLESLKKFSSNCWHTKLRSPEEYVGCLRDLLYVFQLNVIVYHRLDKLNKYVFLEDSVELYELEEEKKRKKSKSRKFKKKNRSKNQVQSMSGGEERIIEEEEEEIEILDKKSYLSPSSNNITIDIADNIIEEDQESRDELGLYIDEDDFDYHSYLMKTKNKKYIDIWFFQKNVETNHSIIFCLKMLSYINKQWFAQPPEETKSKKKSKKKSSENSKGESKSNKPLKMKLRLFYMVNSPSLVPVYERLFNQMLKDCRVREEVLMNIQCYSNLSHRYYYDSIPDLEKAILYAEMLKKFSEKETALIFAVFDPPSPNHLISNEYWKKLKILVNSVETPMLLFYSPDTDDSEEDDAVDL